MLPYAEISKQVGFRTGRGGLPPVNHNYLSITAGLFAALSTSKLFSTSTNSAELVRNSDGTIQTFGFLNDFIDDAAIQAFAPGGANLSNLIDQSGAGNHFGQGTTNLQPVYQAGGLCFEFQGHLFPYNKIEASGILVNSDITVFVLLKQTLPFNGSILQSNAAGAFTTFQYGGYENYQQQLYNGNGLFTSLYSGPFLTANTYCLTMLDITAANAGTMYVRGQVDTTFTNLYTGTFTPAIGGNDYRPFDGELKEMLIYQGSLSPADQTTVINNIVTRWSL